MINARDMIRVSIFFICAMACLFAAPERAYTQSNEYHWVNVCNRGDVDLLYVVLATRQNFLLGDSAQLSGWHTIRKGKCEDVSILTYQAVTIGFAHERAQGGLGNPVYIPSDATPANGNKYAPSVLCVPKSGSVRRKGSLSSVLSASSQPCASGEYALKMSFYEKPGNFEPKFIVKPSTNESLAPWPQKLSPPPQNTKQRSASPPMQGSDDLASQRQTMYSTLCQDSLFAIYFQMNGANAETACPCFADQLVKNENAETLDAIDRNLRRNERRFNLLGNNKNHDEQKENLDTAIKQVVREENVTAYIKHCIKAEK